MLRRSARELDKIVRRKITAGLPLGGDIQLLYEAYWAAFQASKIKGIADKAAKSKRAAEEAITTQPDLHISAQSTN